MLAIEKDIAKMMLGKYEQQVKNEEIILIPHDTHCRGILEHFTFVKDRLYKLIFPVEIPDTESFTLVMIYKTKKENRSYALQHTVYEIDTKRCLLKVSKDVTVYIHFYKGVHFFGLDYEREFQ